VLPSSPGATQLSSTVPDEAPVAATRLATAAGAEASAVGPISLSSVEGRGSWCASKDGAGDRGNNKANSVTTVKKRPDNIRVFASASYLLAGFPIRQIQYSTTAPGSKTPPLRMGEMV